MKIVREKSTKKVACLHGDGDELTFTPSGLQAPDVLYMGITDATHEIVSGSEPAPPLYWVVDALAYDSDVWSILDQEQYDKNVDHTKNMLTSEVRRKRAKEYPSMFDYLDGIVKGDQAQMQAYIDACIAVKEKYPKPQ